MKKNIIVMLAMITMLIKQAPCQVQEAQQLLLNVEKLSQLKKILNNMYTGYKVITKGYNTIKDISKGNFDLHEVFLDGLMEVSPVVKKYKRVADIIKVQLQLVREYKTVFNQIKVSKLFNSKEIAYLASVYSQLIDKSLGNLGELTLIVTAKQLRMSDDERLAAIDRIYADMMDKLSFIGDFNTSNHMLALQRAKETNDVKGVQQLYGIK